MGLIGSSGSYERISPEQKPADPRQTELLTPPNSLATTDRDFVKLAQITDTLANRTSVNPERFSEEYRTLLGFPDGSPIVVTFYHQVTTDPSVRSLNADVSLKNSGVHRDLVCIKDFEFRLTAPMTSNFNDQEASIEITGEGVMYPGFIPSVGDFFAVNVGDGKLVLFKVNNVQRLSYRQGAFHRVGFESIDYLNAETLEELQQGVTNTVYFDRNRYLDGDYSFLTHESYVHQRDLQHKRLELIQTYYRQFYDAYLGTLVRPDTAYDPYVVRFLLEKVSIREAKVRPTQLYHRMADYDRSLWYLLLGSASNDRSMLLGTCWTDLHRPEVFDTDLNALANRAYIRLGTPPEEMQLQPTTEDYVFGPAFYLQGALLTRLEQTVAEYLQGEPLNPATVLDICANYRRLNPLQWFYHGPLYIHLIDECLRTL